MKNLSTSIYTFEKLRQANCVYVDKTEYLYKLVTGASQQVFCACPRRFGKSLTVSTLEAIFRGKRELFEGLYIAGQNYHGLAESGSAVNRKDLQTEEQIQEWAIASSRLL